MYRLHFHVLSLPVAAIVCIALASYCAAQTEDAPVPVPCFQLSDYVDPAYQDNLKIFMGGGDISSDAPVMFTVPRTEISLPDAQVKLCIENLEIPSSVGEVPCDSWQKCWLIIGRHTGSDPNPDDVQYCKSSNSYRGTAPCYKCTCSGADVGTGSIPADRTLAGACGLNSQNSWGTQCPDVMNGRYNAATDEYSNSSTIQVNICGGIEDDCNICQDGGYQPGFRVGLQWSNRMDQCFDKNPFTSGASATKIYHVITLALSISTAIASLFGLDYM